jgi:hypothetical protein
VKTSAHYPISARIEKHAFNPTSPEHSQYGLWLRYSANGPERLIQGVHLPPLILAAFESGAVQTIFIEQIEINSIAAKTLPRQPNYLITCVVLNDGHQLRDAPPALVRARRRLTTFAALAITASIYLLCAAQGPVFAWTGAIALAFGMHFAQMARRLPTMKFNAHEHIKSM